MVSRRELLATGAALTAAGAAQALPASGPFVRRDGTRFIRGGKPYRYAGANIWYGAYLGADAPFGNRARLSRELDALQAIGVTNLRLLASSEKGPLKNAVRPSFRDQSNVWNPALLGGLDWCLAEMGKRGMTAVLYLTNFWEWSGGMMTYLQYFNGGDWINNGDPAHPWPEFANKTAQFYATPPAVAAYYDWIRAIVGRTNAVTGTPYAQDPTIMAWQLANEPRPAGDEPTALKLLPAFYAWIQGSAKLIKSIDRNHLVCTGSEGLKGTVERADIYLKEHGFPEIDYCTTHIWPLNWDWVSAKDIPGTNEAAFAKVRDYIAANTALATQLGKPLVIEEFGYPRDGGGYDPESSTHFKDGYYKLIYDAVEASIAAGGPIHGSNFWAWNGEGRAAHGDHHYQDGDDFVGDPPHEPQGWYGVFDSDATTKAVIAAHAKALAGMA